MKRLLLLLLMCGLLVACEEEASIDPKPATPENAEAFVSRLKPGYTTRDVFQVPLGEDYQGTDSSDIFKADGVVIGSIVDGPRAAPRGDTIMLYKGPDERIAWLEAYPYSSGTTRGGTHFSELETARALRRFLEERR